MFLATSARDSRYYVMTPKSRRPQRSRIPNSKVEQGDIKSDTAKVGKGVTLYRKNNWRAYVLCIIS
jgi:hypothetical protein